MAKPMPNPILVRFSDAVVPEAWRSRQAKALYDAGMEGEADGSWMSEAVAGTVRIAQQPPVDSAMSPYGTDEDTARLRVERHIAKLRAEADKMERILGAYSATAFIERFEPVAAPKHPFEAEPWLIERLRCAWTHIKINGRTFVRDASGSAVRV